MADKPLKINDNGELSEISDGSEFYDGRRYTPSFLESDKILTVPTRNQMIICDEYVIEDDAELILEENAELCII